MPQYEIDLSKEAGVYTKTIIIEAENWDDANSKALDVCENPEHDKWEYSEGGWNEPFIQVEQCEEIEND
jgi:hypothetical protein